MLFSLSPFFVLRRFFVFFAASSSSYGFCAGLFANNFLAVKNFLFVSVSRPSWLLRTIFFSPVGNRIINDYVGQIGFALGSVKIIKSINTGFLNEQFSELKSENEFLEKTRQNCLEWA